MLESLKQSLSLTNTAIILRFPKANPCAHALSLQKIAKREELKLIFRAFNSRRGPVPSVSLIRIHQNSSNLLEPVIYFSSNCFSTFSLVYAIILFSVRGGKFSFSIFAEIRNPTYWFFLPPLTGRGQSLRGKERNPASLKEISIRLVVTLFVSSDSLHPVKTLLIVFLSV